LDNDGRRVSLMLAPSLYSSRSVLCVGSSQALFVRETPRQTPNSRDIAACRPWLEAELRLIKPRVLVCVGSTAAATIFGAGAPVLRDRGQVRESKFAGKNMISFHPSALLRAPDEATQYAQFVSDLRAAINCIKTPTKPLN